MSTKTIEGKITEFRGFKIIEAETNEVILMKGATFGGTFGPVSEYNVQQAKNHVINRGNRFISLLLNNQPIDVTGKYSVIYNRYDLSWGELVPAYIRLRNVQYDGKFSNELTTACNRFYECLDMDDVESAWTAIVEFLSFLADNNIELIQLPINK